MEDTCIKLEAIEKSLIRCDKKQIKRIPFSTIYFDGCQTYAFSPFFWTFSQNLRRRSPNQSDEKELK